MSLLCFIRLWPPFPSCFSAALQLDGVLRWRYTERALLCQRAVLPQWAFRGFPVPMHIRTGGATRRHFAMEPIQTWEEEEEESGLGAGPGWEGSGSCCRWGQESHFSLEMWNDCYHFEQLVLHVCVQGAQEKWCGKLLLLTNQRREVIWNL